MAIDIDHSIYQNIKPVDLVGAYQQGQQIRQQNQKFDREKAISDLELQGRLLGDVKDQQTYTLGREKAAQMGLDISKVPEVYDPAFVKNIYNMSMSQLDKLKAQRDAQDYRLREREVVAAEKAAGVKRFKDELAGEYLPFEQKKVATDLSGKNANKVAIKNQIDSVVGQWDSLTEDQKIASGRQLLKTLNSTEGADAIGVEEANRLGSKLEFAMGNLFNSNPVQFGRDLAGFKEQAKNTSKAIGQSIKSNQEIIKGITGRGGSININDQKNEMQAAIDWVNKNPNDPRAAKIIKKINMQGGR